MNEIKIALLGLGTVGSGVVKVLESHGAEMQARAGCRLVLRRVADADLTRPREGLDLGRLPLVGDANRVLDDPEVQIVIELVGGLEPARTFILKALVPCLREFPLLNAMLDEEAGEIVLKKYYNIGIATDTERGLTVPVVQDVPLARALHKLCDLDQEIPVELYEAVARVLALIFALKRDRRPSPGVHVLTP